MEDKHEFADFDFADVDEIDYPEGWEGLKAGLIFFGAVGLVISAVWMLLQ